MSERKTVALTTSLRPQPTFDSLASMWARRFWVWARNTDGGVPVFGSVPTCPETKTNGPAATAPEKGDFPGAGGSIRWIMVSGTAKIWRGINISPRGCALVESWTRASPAHPDSKRLFVKTLLFSRRPGKGPGHEGEDRAEDSDLQRDCGRSCNYHRGWRDALPIPARIPRSRVKIGHLQHLGQSKRLAALGRVPVEVSVCGGHISGQRQLGDFHNIPERTGQQLTHCRYPLVIGGRSAVYPFEELRRRSVPGREL